jgi:Bacteriophage tail sheath protein
MAVSPTYPGVYIDELPNPVRTIIGVPTAVAAFVGPAARGPVDEPSHITSWSDFDRIYGGLSAASLMSYAVFHYYQNGGSEAEIVRVAARDAPAMIDLGPAGGGVKLQALKAGAAGNDIKARVDYDPGDAAIYKLQVKGDAQTFTITADATPDKPDSLDQQLNKSTLVRAAPDTARVKPPESPPAVGGDPFGDPAIPQGKGGQDGASRARINLPTDTKDKNDNAVFVALEAKYPGGWANALSVVVDHDTIDTKTQYNLTVTDPDPDHGSQETWRNISTDKNSPQTLDRVLDSSRLVRPMPGTPLDVQPKAGAVTVTVNGTDGPQVTETELIGVDGVTKSGIYALRNTDIFNILCVPPIDRTSSFMGSLYSAAGELCVERRSMLVVDPPVRWTDVDTAVANFDHLQPNDDNAKNAAVYFPWIKLADKDGMLLQFPPSGAVAGVWARTDGQRNVAKAPAGTDASLSGVTELVVKLTDPENGRLNPLGVNCLRTFPAVGSVVWGARTLRGADRLANQWKYVPVRRTALFIEETLYRSTQWVVFEPNDEPLWAAIRLNVGAFMNTLFRQGMFQGRTPQEAYLIKCDKDNNPQNDIDRGIVNILVGFAPLKPAEFVLVHIQQLAGQIQV